jgi:phosphopantothenoylcysteine decarboxylase/phosphopantothenate--cysteine ligase
MNGKTIVLGVTGGIAAYKACELASRLTQRGARVPVVMTPSATRFVSPLTFQALTLQPVHTSLWPESHSDESGVAAAMAHISLANEAHAILVAPASADFLSRAARGGADDLLSTLLLATRAPVLLAPAMNPAMWSHPATQSNRQVLEGLGYGFAEPESGRMACEHQGVGRLPTTEALIARLEEVLQPAPRDLEGLQVLVTAGPTREPLDPVRYISNRSSGKMGYAVAQEAARRGARVTLVSGPVSLTAPSGVERVSVTTTQQMFDAVQARFSSCDVLVASAAPADFRARDVQAHKIKKRGDRLALELEANPDIVATAARGKKPEQLVIGFAAETRDVKEEAQRKRLDKNLDAVVANDVSQNDAGFDVDTNRVLWVSAAGAQEWPLLSKVEVARRIWNEIAVLRASQR